MTSSNQLAVVQAKEGDMWEPTTDAELDRMEAVLEAQAVCLDEPLADRAIIRHCPVP